MNFKAQIPIQDDFWARIDPKAARQRQAQGNTMWTLLKKDPKMLKRLYLWTCAMFGLPILVYFFAFFVVFVDSPIVRVDYSGYASLAAVHVVLVAFMFAAFTEKDDEDESTTTTTTTKSTVSSSSSAEEQDPGMFDISKYDFTADDDMEVDEDLAMWSDNDDEKYKVQWKPDPTEKYGFNYDSADEDLDESVAQWGEEDDEKYGVTWTDGDNKKNKKKTPTSVRKRSTSSKRRSQK